MKGLAIETLSLTHGTPHPDISQEIHFQFVGSVSFTRLAASAFDVEAKASRCVTALLGLGELRVEFANLVKQFDVGSRIRTRRTSDRRLINGDHFVEVFDAVEAVVIARIADAAIEFLPQGLNQNLVDERTLPAARDTRYANKFPQRDLDVDIFEIVVSGTANRYLFGRITLATKLGDLNLKVASEIPCRKTFL